MATSDYNPEPEIPYGYCHCGCGQKTKISVRNNFKYGYLKNQPQLYIRGHINRRTLGQKYITFWSHVAITADDNQCWLWLISKNAYGYGQFQLGEEQIASRIAWSYPNYIIPTGMIICHSCDNHACCNPKHLFLGTHQDNMTDMVQKGRSTKGMDINRQKNRRKITKEEESEIIERFFKGGITQPQLAKEYNIAINHVRRLIRFQRYLK